MCPHLPPIGNIIKSWGQGGHMDFFLARMLEQNLAQYQHENYSDFQILSLWDLPLAYTMLTHNTLNLHS